MTRNMELHDHFPKKMWYKKIRIIWAIVLLFMLLTIIATGIIVNEESWKTAILIILIIGLFVSYGYLTIWTYYTRVFRLWDNMDYSDFIKTDFEFTASDGLKHFSYLYTRKDIDFDKDPSPKTTIIGLHGWGTNHREMDRYCLPTVKEEGYLFFTFDARGQGWTKGDRNDPKQFTDTLEFIEKVKNLPYVDKSNIIIIAMSMGALKASIHAYPDPDIKLLILMSGPYDLKLTKEKMGTIDKIIFKLGGFKWTATEEQYRKLNGLSYFKPEGIVLSGDTKPTPNSERVFMAHTLNDLLVHYENTEKAIEILNLDEENYRLYKKGKHVYESNEWMLSVAIHNFIKKKLSLKSHN